MNINIMAVIKCIGVGMLIGAGLGLLGCHTMKNDRCVKKKAKKALHNMEDFLEDIQYMFK